MVQLDLHKLFEKYRQEIAVPERATIRLEYIKCGNYECRKLHGPYLYAYWKENGILKKRYLGKSLEDYEAKLLWKASNKTIGGGKITFITKTKLEYIFRQADNGNEFAQTYRKKLDEGLISIDWAYKKVKEHVEDHRVVRALLLAERRGYRTDKPEELISFIISEMKDKGLEADTEEQFDGYLNSEFR